MRLEFKNKNETKTLNISDKIMLWGKNQTIEFPTENEANEYLASNSYTYFYAK